MSKPRCSDCGKPGAWICPRCKKERHRLRAQRRKNERRGENVHPPDGHEERILYYMSRAKKKKPLFE